LTFTEINESLLYVNHYGFTDREVFDEQMVNFAQNARNFVLFHEKWPLTNRFVVSTGIRICVVIVVYLVQIHNQKFLMHPGGWR
jgi:hypothetical protein